MKALVKPFAYLLALAFLSFACSEDGGEQPQPQPGKTLNEWGQSMLQIEQIATEMEMVARGTHPNGSSFMSCSTVENKQTPDGLETTVTFYGVACQDGKTRNGKIILLTSNNPNLEAVLYLDNYQVNGTKLEGAFAFQMIQVPGKASVVRMVSSNAQVLPANGASFSYSLNRVTHLKEGAATPHDTADDVVELYDAEYSCLKQNGTFEASLVAPVVLKKTCVVPANMKPVQGKIQMEMTTGQKSTLNFGDGTCASQPFAE